MAFEAFSGIHGWLLSSSCCLFEFILFGSDSLALNIAVESSSLGMNSGLFIVPGTLVL